MTDARRRFVLLWFGASIVGVMIVFAITVSPLIAEAVENESSIVAQADSEIVLVAPRKTIPQTSKKSRKPISEKPMRVDRRIKFAESVMIYGNHAPQDSDNSLPLRSGAQRGSVANQLRQLVLYPRWDHRFYSGPRLGGIF